MRHFLLILLLTIIAFADALRSISTSNVGDAQFVGSEVDSILYVYRMVPY